MPGTRMYSTSEDGNAGMEDARPGLHRFHPHVVRIQTQGFPPGSILAGLQAAVSTETFARYLLPKHPGVLESMGVLDATR